MQSYISETRMPFTRLGDKSCVYYGIRGNTRSQYMFDKSCALEGASLGDEVINRVGVLFNGAALGVGVMPVINGPMPTLLGNSLPTLLSGKMPTLLGGKLPSLLSGSGSRVTLLGGPRPVLLGSDVELLGDPMTTTSKVLIGLGVVAAGVGAYFAFGTKSKKKGSRGRRRKGRR